MIKLGIKRFWRIDVLGSVLQLLIWQRHSRSVGIKSTFDADYLAIHVDQL